MKKTSMLRKLLKKPGILIVPAAYDCLSARIIEAVGFKAFVMPPSMTDDAQFGLPPTGLATATEVVNCARYIANSVNIPFIMSGEDVYGGSLAAYRTTQEVIRSGAAGIFISDRKHLVLARAPHNLVEVLPRDEYLGKMGAVLEARDKEDKDFIIVARIDAAATLGDEEVIARSKACTELGVDVIFPHSIAPELNFGQKDKKHLEQFYKAMGAPDVMIWCLGPRGSTAKDCEDLGAKLWVPPDSVMSAVKKTLFDVYREVYETGSYTASPGISIMEDSNKSQGLDFWRELEKKYVP